MGVFFTTGETKKRPGVYQRYENIGGAASASAVNGVAAAVIEANWGKCGVVTTIGSVGEIEPMFGNGASTEVLREIFRGGARMIHVVRVGEGSIGAAAELVDATATSTKLVAVTLKYPTTRKFSYKLENAPGDSAHKVFSIFEDTKTLREKIVFASGTGEVNNFKDAAKSSVYVNVEVLSAATDANKLAIVTADTPFAAGTINAITAASYETALNLLEPYTWNTVSIDSSDADKLAKVAAFIDRAYDNGKMAFAVIGEPVIVGNTVTPLATRMDNAKSYNSYNVIYVGGGWKDNTGKEYQGYLAAARIAGMVAAVPANESLTRRVIAGAVEPLEMLTNAKYIDTIDHGMLTFSQSSTGSVWIEDAITTLVSPSGNDDEGWKKIKRAKIRFELMNRASNSVEPLVGNVLNNDSGRSTVLIALQGVCNDMVSEGKLLDGAKASLDSSNPPSGDSAWFVISADDVDSMEKAYLTFQFRFTPTV